MTKEKLIELGLTEELATKVIENFGEMIPQGRFTEVVEEKNNYKKQLEERDKQLSELQKNNSNNEELKAQIEKLQAENKANQENYETNIARLKLDNALDNALNLAGSKNNIAIKALLKMDNIKLDGDKLIGFDEQVAELKKNADYLFKVEETKTPAPAGTTPSNGNTGTAPTSENITLAGALAKEYNK